MTMVTPLNDITESKIAYSWPDARIGRLVVLAIAMMFLTRNITGWYIGLHDWNSATFSVFARNHVEYGLGHTKLFCTWGDTATPAIEPRRYLNHPPLLAMFVALPMLILGDHEWVCRTVPIAATLGSTYLIMVIISRLYSDSLSLIAGTFYVCFPVVAYFGRMVCHESPVQFFILLMVHGYLQWAGLYGSHYSRSRGAILYFVAVFLGIGTGWAAVLPAGLLWLWHCSRLLRNRSASVMMIWLLVTPAVCLGAVVLHILYGCHWNIDMVSALLDSRAGWSVDAVKVRPWAEWFTKNWRFATQNFSPMGVYALIVSPISVLVICLIDKRRPDTQPATTFRSVLVPFCLLFVQGMFWLVIFRRQSYIHQYWQFHMAPFVCLALATQAMAVYRLLALWTPRTASVALAVLIMMPIPSFARSLEELHYKRSVSPYSIEALIRLAKIVPPRVPVMVSWYPRGGYTELFGTVKNYWQQPQIAYYAHRPLIFQSDYKKIQADTQGCAAYLLEVSSSRRITELRHQLASNHKNIFSWGGYLAFDLKKPIAGTPDLKKPIAGTPSRGMVKEAERPKPPASRDAAAARDGRERQ